MGQKISPPPLLAPSSPTSRGDLESPSGPNTYGLAGRRKSSDMPLPFGMPAARSDAPKGSPGKIQRIPLEILREIVGHLLPKDVVALGDADPGISVGIVSEIAAAHITIKENEELEARFEAIKRKLPKLGTINDFKNLFKKEPTIQSLPEDKQDEILTQLPSLIFQLYPGDQRAAMEYLQSVFMPESEPQPPLIKAFQSSANKGFLGFVEDHEASVKQAIELAHGMDHRHEKISDLIKQFGMLADSVTMEGIACDNFMNIYGTVDPAILAAIRNHDGNGPVEADKAILAIAERHGICQGVMTKNNICTKDHIRKEIAKHAFEHGENMQDVLTCFRIDNARKISSLPEYNMDEDFRHEDLSKLDKVKQFNGLLYGKRSILTLPKEQQGELLAALACRIRRIEWSDQPEVIKSLLGAQLPSPDHQPMLLKQVLEVAHNEGQVGLIAEENGRHNKAIALARTADYKHVHAADLIRNNGITHPESISTIEIMASNRFMKTYKEVDPAILSAIENHDGTEPEQADKAVDAIAEHHKIYSKDGIDNTRVEIAKHAIEHGVDFQAVLKVLRITNLATVKYLEDTAPISVKKELQRLKEAPGVLVSAYEANGDEAISNAISRYDSKETAEAIKAFASCQGSPTPACLLALTRAVADKALNDGTDKKLLGKCLQATDLCDASLLVHLNVDNYAMAYSRW